MTITSKCILQFIIILLLMGCRSSDKPALHVPQTFKAMRTLFKDPPARFRTAPLWVWNDEMTENKIRDQLVDFKEKGMGGVFVHPRPGLITPYLSERWNQLFQYTVDIGNQLDMYVWIYDENSYPSGFAGGHVPAEMPESWNQGQGLNMIRKDTLKMDPASEYELVLVRSSSGFEDITSQTEIYMDTPGAFYLFEKAYYQSSPWHGGYSYVDLLVPGVTEKFIDMTMSGYETVSREDFGYSVPGIFTDEPNINAPGQIRWTPDLFERFQERWNYDLRSHLPSLLMERGDFMRIRHNYYALLLELFIERWSKPWFEYTEDQNLLWTGHYWEHGWPDPSEGPDNMAMYAWHQVPGIDILMNQYHESVNAQFGNVRAVKEVRSVANQMGRTRTLSETYGAGGWDLSFEDMKRIADWQYALGVNFLNQHLSYVTIMGARKRDHPQSFSYHEPWWEQYRVMADYCARLSVAMSSGEQRNMTLVIEPTTTAWMYYAPGNIHKNFSILSHAFQDLVNHFEAMHLEYDLGSENIIKRYGRVKDGTLNIGERHYSKVVLPPTLENLDKSTFELIQEILETGGRIISLGPIPGYLDGKETNEIKDLADEYQRQWLRFEGFTDPHLEKELWAPDFRVINPESIQGTLFHHRRILNDGQLVLLVNTSENKWANGNFLINGGGVVHLNAFDGTEKPYPFSNEAGKINVAFQIPPVGELLLYIRNADGMHLSDVPDKPFVRILNFEQPTEIRRVDMNSLILDYCDLSFESGESFEDMYFFNAADRIFRYYGFNGNPWSRAVQYKTNIIDKDIMNSKSGFQASFHFYAEPGVDELSLNVIVERSWLWDVYINDVLVKPKENAYYLDATFGIFPMDTLLKSGRNTIKLKASEMTVHSELEPVYLTGNFSLEPIKRGWKVIPAQPLTTDPWSRQGMPFYAGRVSYTQSIQISNLNDHAHYILNVPDWNGSVADVFVNGKPGGIIGWHPYELDVTPHLIKGKNTISFTITGTLKNLLGPHHFDPAPGAAWPTQFESGPKHQPDGNSYSVIEYGLFGRMNLFEIDGDVPQYYAPFYRVSDPVLHFPTHLIRGDPVPVRATSTTPGAVMRYSLDEHDVDTESPVIPENLYLNTTTQLRVKAFNENMLPSHTVIQDFYRVNILQVRYDKPYSSKYMAQGNQALIDNRLGSANFNDGNWQGFEEDDLEVIIEFLEEQSVEEVSMRFLQNIGSWIYYPSKVYVEYSTDGISYKKFKSVSVNMFEAEPGLPLKEVRMISGPVKATHLKVIARNMGTCPAGDPGAGGKAWLFIDEIQIQ